MVEMKPTLLVLAAWMWSRYWGIKQLDGFGPNGETLLEYAVFDAVRAGFGKVVFIIRQEFAQEFKERFHDIFSRYIEVAYVFQEIPQWRTKPWGTGQAILCAKDVIHEPFAVINADDYYGVDGFRQIAKTLEKVDPENMCMVWYVLENTLSESGGVNRGICTTALTPTNKKVLKSVEEHLKIQRNEDGVIRDEKGDVFERESVVSMNFWWFHPILFSYLQEQFSEFLSKQDDGSTQEFYIPTVIDRLIHEGRVSCDVLVSRDLWCGVTYKEDKPFVENLIKNLVQEGVYPAYLWGASASN